MEFGCCNCGESIDLDIPHKVCADCGAFCCDEDCLNEHECDEEGDLGRDENEF